MHFYNGYIYLIYIREYLLQGLPIYKIGMTADLVERLRQYPKGSMYIYTCYCENISITENRIKKIFIDLFYQKRNLGVEYFEGNVHQMVSVIHTHVQLDFVNNVIPVQINLHKKQNKAASIIQKHYKAYLNKKKDVDTEKTYTQIISKFMNTEIIISPKDFLPLKDVKTLWNLRYPQLSMDDDIFKLRFKKIFGKIEIRKSKQGWLGYKFEKKKTLNDEIQNFINKEIEDNNDENNFLKFLEIKAIWDQLKPSIQYNDNILKTKIENYAGVIQKINGVEGWSNIKLKNVEEKKVKYELQLYDKYFIYIYNNSSRSDKDKKEMKFDREEYINFIRKKESDIDFNINPTEFGLDMSKMKYVRKFKPSGKTLYFLKIPEMIGYLNKQGYKVEKANDKSI